MPGPSGVASLSRQPTRGPAGAPRPGGEKGIAGLKRIYKDVDWSVSFVCLLIYFVIVITYRFPGASFAIVGAVVGLIFEKGPRTVPYWLVWFLALLLWGTVSVTQSSFPDAAWNEGVVEYAKVWLICLVAVNVLTNSARLRFFLIFFLFLYATHPIRGALFNTFVYRSLEESRAVWNGMWSNPNDFAALTFLPLAIAAGLLKDPSDLVRKAALASVAVMPVIMLMTRSRGGFLALAVFSLLTVLANRKQLKGLVGLGVLGLGALLMAPEGTFDRFNDMTSAVRGGTSRTRTTPIRLSSGWKSGGSRTKSSKNTPSSGSVCPCITTSTDCMLAPAPRRRSGLGRGTRTARS